LASKISDGVSYPEAEGLCCDEEAGLYIGDFAVIFDFVTPKAWQGAKPFGGGERHVDEEALRVRREESAHRFPGS
jgi:hypothetical protein